jgi:hypothetical protein
MDAPRFPFAGLGEKLRHMKERFRGDAADIKAGAPRLLQRIDHRDLHALVGRQKSRGITPGATTYNDQFTLNRLGHTFS